MVLPYHSDGMNAPAAILTSPRRKNCFIALEQESGEAESFPLPLLTSCSIRLRQVHFRLSTLALKYSVPLS